MNKFIISQVRDTSTVRDFYFTILDNKTSKKHIYKISNTTDVLDAKNKLAKNLKDTNSTILTIKDSCGKKYYGKKLVDFKDSNHIYGKGWHDFIKKLDAAGYAVDGAYRDRPEEFILAYKNGKTYELEIIGYYPEGIFDLSSANIREAWWL